MCRYPPLGLSHQTRCPFTIIYNNNSNAIAFLGSPPQSDQLEIEDNSIGAIIQILVIFLLAYLNYHVKVLQTNLMSSPLLKYEEDFPLEEIDERYDALLSEYSKLKSEVGSLKSEKQLDAQLAECTNAAKNQEVGPTVTVTQEDIDRLNAKKEEVISKFAISNRELEDKIGKKKAELESSVSHLQTNGDVVTHKNKLVTEVENIERQITDRKRNLDKLIKDGELRKQQFESAQQHNRKLHDSQQSAIAQAKKQIQTLKSEKQQLTNKVGSIKKELSQLIQANKASTKSKSPEDIEKQIATAEADLKKEKENHENILKQIQTDGQNLTISEKVSKQIADKEVALKKQIQAKKENEQRIRKLIDSHVNSYKKLQEEKKESKTKQNDEVAQLKKTENENNFLESSINWEKKRLDEFKQIKKTYVDKKVMEDLYQKKKQFEKFNKNAEGDASKFESLQNKLKGLKDQMSKLQKRNLKQTNQKQNQVKQLKQKNNDLRKKKEELEKSMTENKTKLDEYKKQYPDHEEDKAKATEEEKRQKAELIKRKQEQALAKKAQEKKKVKVEAKATEEEDLQKYLPRVSSNDKSQSILSGNSAYVAAGAVAVLIIGVASYYSL